MNNSTLARWLALGIGAAAGAYAAYVGTTWWRYGRVKPARGKAADPLLDVFMPVYEIAERHRVYVAAPADVTMAAAVDVDLKGSGIVRAIFKGRELAMGSRPDDRTQPRGLLAEMKSLGWVVLAEIPHREIVAGAVTRPWEANVVFRSVPAEAFAAFDEPDYVKIAWTLRADPLGPGNSIARTETRVVATDSTSRRKFRRYWSLASPGILLIRRFLMKRVKRQAERRARWPRSRNPGTDLATGQAALLPTGVTSRAAPASGGSR